VIGTTGKFLSKNNLVHLDDHRPHAVKISLCISCASWHITIHPVGTDEKKLECDRCGAQNSYCFDIPADWI